MINYREAFRLPFTNWKRAGILFIIGLFTNLINLLDEKTALLLGFPFVSGAVGLVIYVIAIFSSLLLAGYTIRIAGSAAAGRNELPSFANIPSMLVQGLKYIAAVIVYIIPLLVLFVIGIAANTLRSLAVLALIILAVFALVVLLGYVLPLVLVHFAHENRFAAFFELRKILKYAFTSTYFVALLVAAAYSFAAFIPLLIPFFMMLFAVGAVPALISMVLLGAVYTTIITPTTTSLYGQAYREVRGATVIVKPAAGKAKPMKAAKKAAKSAKR